MADDKTKIIESAAGLNCTTDYYGNFKTIASDSETAPTKSSDVKPAFGSKILTFVPGRVRRGIWHPSCPWCVHIVFAVAVLWIILLHICLGVVVVNDLPVWVSSTFRPTVVHHHWNMANRTVIIKSQTNKLPTTTSTIFFHFDQKIMLIHLPDQDICLYGTCPDLVWPTQETSHQTTWELALKAATSAVTTAMWRKMRTLHVGLPPLSTIPKEITTLCPKQTKGPGEISPPHSDWATIY